MSGKVIKTEAEWRAQLTAEQYHVTREHGTERAFTGALDKHYEDGIYHCVCCGEELFSSGTKFTSGLGANSQEKTGRGRMAAQGLVQE